VHDKCRETPHTRSSMRPTARRGHRCCGQCRDLHWEPYLGIGDAPLTLDSLPMLLAALLAATAAALDSILLVVVVIVVVAALTATALLHVVTVLGITHVLPTDTIIKAPPRQRVTQTNSTRG
jgi:hypothetical protein